MTSAAKRVVRAVHVIASIAPAEGGPSYSVPRLCEALSAKAEIALLSLLGDGMAPFDRASSAWSDRRFEQDFARLPVVRALRMSSTLHRAIRDMAPATSIIHSHGLWLMPGIYAARAAKGSGRPCVISPRGMLSPVALSFSRRKKWAFWRLLQQQALRRAACLHATSEAEFRDIRAMGLANPVAVIPNGVDIPAEHMQRPSGSERTLLSLGRLHPKKGLIQLMRAWGRVESAFPDWRLRIVGPAERGHDRELKDLAVALGVSRVSIEGPIYGPEKLEAYRAADAFVLPSFDENFAVSVAEALASGTPVIASRGAPWAGLEDERCGWWVEQHPESLAAALAVAMALPKDALQSMGARGRVWMARDFSWDSVAREMLEVYGWLAHGDAPPPTVRLDP
jgi:glycosyltransferase involved in cell wall biosynthesis